MAPKPSWLTVTDQFCGAGGSSLGAAAAGLQLRMALNHWPLAIETHNSNFPHAAHACVDISSTDPRRYPSTHVLLTSPECTHHTYARGKGRSSPQAMLPGLGLDEQASADRSRATMWDVPRFAEVHKYELIVVENVVEARQWVMFDAWLHAMQSLGYEHKAVFYNSMFAPPTPQSRDRMYMVFWRRGNVAPDLEFTARAHCASCADDVDAVQSWKNPDRPYGRYRAQYVYRCGRCLQPVEPYRLPAAGVIDWSLPALRIGDRERPLKPATMERIERGVDRFFRRGEILPLITQTTYPGDLTRLPYPVDRPLPTQTARQSVGVVAPPPFIAELHGTSTARSVTEPLSTVLAGGTHHLLVDAPPSCIVANFTPGWVRPIAEPLGSITTQDHHSLLSAPPAFVTSYYSQDGGHPVSDPLGTISTIDRHGVVAAMTVGDLQEALHAVKTEDCTFRMLSPDELQAAMAFPSDYRVLGTNREKVRQLGNAVTPPVMQMLLERCVETLL